MSRWASYVKPTSLTWWGGVILVASGLLRIWQVEIPFLTPAVRPVIDVLFGTSDPGFLIFTGLGFIGIRARLARGGEV